MHTSLRPVNLTVTGITNRRNVKILGFVITLFLFMTLIFQAKPVFATGPLKCADLLVVQKKCLSICVRDSRGPECPEICNKTYEELSKDCKKIQP